MREKPGRGVAIGERYRLDELLGQGGFGQVWAGTHLATLGRVALKILNGPWCLQPEARVRFLREARAATAVRHPNVVRVHDFFELEGGTPVMVMDLLVGETLRDHLKREHALSLERALDVLLPVISALGTAHAAGVVHRDVKPDNVFLVTTASGELAPRVLDFGLAKLARDAGAAREQEPATKSGEMLGTLGYMSPEQAFGSRHVDHRTDIWALGATLYECLCGSRAMGDSVARVMSHLVGQVAINPLERLVPGLPRDVAALVQRMLSLDPAERPSDLREVIQVLSVHSRIEVPPIAAALGVGASLGAEGAGAGLEAPELAGGAGAPPDAGASFWSERRGPRVSYHAQRAGGGRTRVDRTALVLVLASGAELEHLYRELVPALFDAAQVELDALRACVRWSELAPGELDRFTRELSDELALCCPGAVSVVFVADTLGTAVVKRLLEREWQSETTESGRTRLRSVAFRTRLLVELCLAGPDGAPFEAGLEQLGEGAASPGVLEIEEAFARRMQQIEQLCLPRPAYRRFDAVVTPGLAPAADANVLHRLAQLIDFPKYVAHRDILVATETVSRAFDVDRATHTRKLLGEPATRSHAGAPRVPPTLAFATAGTQREARERVLAALQLKSARPRRIVVTGDAGVGKSTLVRRLARDTALELLEMGLGAPLPILIPLQQEILSAAELTQIVESGAGERGRAVFDALARRWCDWANTLLSADASALSVQWLERRMRSLPTIVILDGADEFLVNNPGIDVGALRDLINFAFSSFADNGRLSIVLVSRSSQPGVRTLATNALHIFEILSLTVEQAAEAFPDVLALVGAIDDPDARRLVLTPLVLSWLGPRAGQVARRRLHTPAEVLEQALLAIIEESRLTELAASDRDPTDVGQWLDALTLLGWIFYSKLIAQSSIESLIAEARRLVGVWAAFSREHAEDDQSYLMLGGFRLVLEERTLGPLLRRSVFLPTGAGRVRFVHREWLSFLAARYYARCVASGHADELRSVGIAPTLHKLAGDLLARDNVLIDRALVRRILARSRATGEALITANFNALLTSSRVAVEGSAIELLLSSVDDMKPLARFIALNGLGLRALRSDATAAEFRSRLLPVFEAFVQGRAPRDPVLVSICWCYAKAFARHFNTRPPMAPWSFAESPEAERSALGMMCSPADGVPRLSQEHRSVQSAFLETQSLVLSDPFRPISVVHYLYYLVVAYRHRANIDDLARELPAILDPAGPIGAAVLAYQVVPEVANVYAACRRIYAARGEPGAALAPRGGAAFSAAAAHGGARQDGNI